MNDKIRKTFILDTVRNGLDGAVMSMSQTMALLIIIKVFSLGDFYKTMVNGGFFLGMIGALFYVWLCAHLHFRASLLAAVPAIAGALLFFAALIPSDGRIIGFLLTLGLITPGLRIPIFSGIYAQNYPGASRGKLFGWGMQAALVTTAFTAWYFGRLLDADAANYRLILAITSVTCLCSGLVVFAIPSTVLKGKKSGNPFVNLALLWKDPTFAYILVAWFLMGFANLWSRPVRVAYLAESDRGLGLTAVTTSLLLVIIPEITRLIFIPFWARIYDKVNFIVLRLILNLIFGAGLLIFFLTDNLWIIGFACFLGGLAFSGGSIAWNLWITRFAPKDKVNEYMSVHTFLTGIRGLFGPFLAFAMYGKYPAQWIGNISFVLILISCAMLWGIKGKRSRFKEGL